jgi:hypothetical protein
MVNSCRDAATLCDSQLQGQASAEREMREVCALIVCSVCLSWTVAEALAAGCRGAPDRSSQRTARRRITARGTVFFRPLLATVLQAVGLYGYGYEKSCSRRALRSMLERADPDVVAETAILFVPGWLRMLDLAFHTWCRPLAAVTAALVRPFVFLDRHVPSVRRHGYLLATVVVKPEVQTPARST